MLYRQTGSAQSVERMARKGPILKTPPERFSPPCLIHQILHTPFVLNTCKAVAYPSANTRTFESGRMRQNLTNMFSRLNNQFFHTRCTKAIASLWQSKWMRPFFLHYNGKLGLWEDRFDFASCAISSLILNTFYFPPCILSANSETCALYSTFNIIFPLQLFRVLKFFISTRVLMYVLT